MHILILCNQKDCKYCDLTCPVMDTENNSMNLFKCFHPNPQIKQFERNCSSKNEQLLLPKVMSKEKKEYELYICLQYKTAHSIGVDLIEGDSIIDCLNKLDAEVKNSMRLNPHIKRYEITDIKFFGCTKSE